MTSISTILCCRLLSVGVLQWRRRAVSPVDVPHPPRGRASSRVEQEASADLVRHVTSAGEQSCRHQESTVVQLLPETTEVSYTNNPFFHTHSLITSLLPKSLFSFITIIYLLFRERVWMLWCNLFCWKGLQIGLAVYILKKGRIGMQLENIWRA